MVAEEVKNIEWLTTDPVPVAKTSKYVYEDDRVFMISNPKAPATGNFIVSGSSPPSLISEDKQAVNVGYMRDKCRLKFNDIVMDNTYRVRELPEPTENSEAVTKNYCDGNSGKQNTGTGGSVWSFLGGVAGGAISGTLSALAGKGISQMFGTLTGTGLSAIGSLAGNALGSGMRVGSGADWANAKPSQSEGMQQLIDNLEDDIANGGSASGDQANGGSISTGPSAFDGLVTMARNA